MGSVEGDMTLPHQTWWTGSSISLHNKFFHSTLLMKDWECTKCTAHVREFQDGLTCACACETCLGSTLYITLSLGQYRVSKTRSYRTFVMLFFLNIVHYICTLI